MSELTAAQIMILGVIATLIAAGVNLYMKRAGSKPGRRWITVGLYVIAIILGYVWGRPLLPVFPAFPAPVEDASLYAVAIIEWMGLFVVFLGKLVAAASSVVGFATLIYNVLLKNVLDKLGWSDPLPARRLGLIEEAVQRDPPRR